MYNVTTHQRNENQNHEIPLHNPRIGKKKKIKDTNKVVIEQDLTLVFLKLWVIYSLIVRNVLCMVDDPGEPLASTH